MYRFLIVVFSLSLANCYVYKPMEEQPGKEVARSKTNENKTKKKKKPVLLTKEQSMQNMKKDAYYKVYTTDKKSYKMRFKKSDRDSIYGHKKNSEKKSVSIAKKEVEEIKDRRFSKLNSDLITFPILGSLAAGLLLLVL